MTILAAAGGAILTLTVIGAALGNQSPKSRLHDGRPRLPHEDAEA